MSAISHAEPVSRASGLSPVAWLPLVCLPAGVLFLDKHMPAWAFMWTLSFAIFAGLKWLTWWQARNWIPHSPSRSAAYLMLWPGMDAETFLDERVRHAPPEARQWLWATAKTLLGIALLWLIARRVPAELPLVRGWIGLLGLIFLLHFGSFHLIALFWQWMGVSAQPIMAAPILSKNLSEFWGKRWNLGFRQLAHDLIFRPLYKKTGVAFAGFLVFVVSGLLHDLVISVPAGDGYGLPTAYFIVQGLAVMLERSSLGRRLRLQEGVTAWVFAVVVTAAPAFWLFHPPFVTRVILPFLRAIHAL